MMIQIMTIKIKRVNNNINVGNLNAKKLITHILHFIIIVKKHIMVNFQLDHLLTINYLMVLQRIEADHV
jgi:hypothetical protein